MFGCYACITHELEVVISKRAYLTTFPIGLEITPFLLVRVYYVASQHHENVQYTYCQI